MPDSDAAILVQPCDLVFFPADMASGAVVAGDVVSLFRHPGGQLFDHHFDAAFVGGHPLVAEHCDLHVIPSLFCDKNLRMQKPII